MIGKTGENGTLKGRSMSGRVRRSTMTPMLARTNAKSVPILTSSTMATSGTNAARREIRMPKPIVSLAGVPNRGCACASRRGRVHHGTWRRRFGLAPLLATMDQLLRPRR